MPTYSFAIVVEGETAELSGTVEEGDFDAARVSDGVRLAARRAADSYSTAVTAALEEVDANTSLRVLRVEHDGLATLDDIAAHIGRTAPELQELGAEELTAVPTETGEGSAGDARWSLWDVAHWFAERTGDSALLDALGRQVAVTEALNLALALRRQLLELETHDRRAPARWLMDQVGSGSGD